MKHTYRFFAELVDASAQEQLWRIKDEELRHLQQVLRLSVGAQLEVFDGQGCSAYGHLSELRSKEGLVLAKAYAFEAEPSKPLCLAVGALKPGFIDELLPCLVELGIDKIHIFMQESVAKNRLQGKVTERWSKILLSAAKQSKRARLPTLEVWDHFSGLLKVLKSDFPRAYALQAGASEAFLTQIQQTPSTGLCAVVGGEKGFSKAEEQLLHEEGFIPASLGSNILRAYTATIATATLMAAASQR